MAPKLLVETLRRSPSSSITRSGTWALPRLPDLRPTLHSRGHTPPVAVSSKMWRVTHGDASYFTMTGGAGHVSSQIIFWMYWVK